MHPRRLQLLEPPTTQTLALMVVCVHVESHVKEHFYQFGIGKESLAPPSNHDYISSSVVSYSLRTLDVYALKLFIVVKLVRRRKRRRKKEREKENEREIEKE